MSILSTIFGGNQPTAPTAPAPATPGNIPDPQVPVTASPTGDATAPTPQVPVTPAEPESPLDQYKELWDTSENSAGTNEPTSFVPELNQESLQKVMTNVDFSQAVTPETMQAITAGGEDAGAAFMQAMNAVAKQTMVQATLVNNKLTQQAVTNAVESTKNQIPELLRAQAAASHATDSNPIFSNPAIQPVVQATRQQLLEKNPTATPAQITEMTNDYILAMGKAFNPDPATPSVPAGEQDWSTFI